MAEDHTIHGLTKVICPTIVLLKNFL